MIFKAFGGSYAIWTFEEDEGDVKKTNYFEKI